LIDFDYSDDRLYVLEGAGRIVRVYDVSPSFSLLEVEADFAGIGPVESIDAEGDYAFTGGFNGLFAVQVGNLVAPTVLGHAFAGHAIEVIRFYHGVVYARNSQSLLAFEAIGLPLAMTESPARVAKLDIQNFPNPFNSQMTVSFSLDDCAFVRMTIYNALGQRVRSFEEQSMSAGNQRLIWNGTDDHGHSLGSGVYFYRLSRGTDVTTGKMLLLK
jgi:hypothetical protein